MSEHQQAICLRTGRHLFGWLGLLVICGLAGVAATRKLQSPRAASLDPIQSSGVSTISQQSAAVLAPIAPGTVTNNRTLTLVWDWPAEAVSFAVYTGPSRTQLTNRSVVTTNRIALDRAVTYGVASLSAQGIESTLAYWPSNRIAELWLRGMGTNMSGGTNIVRLVAFTNSPPGNMQFWGVADVTVGWQ